MLTTKIQEWREYREKIEEVVRKKLKIIERSKIPWFWKMWLALNEGAELINIDKHLSRLRFEQQIARGRTWNSAKGKGVSQEQVEAARRADIVVLLQNAGVQLYRSGQNWRGLCPFHQEKNPSFYVYTHDNRFHCFGCSKNGDTITLIRELHGLSFVDAVKSLI